MFQELMPLLAQRILLLTLSRVGDEKIRVNVIPKPLKADQRDEDAALKQQKKQPGNRPTQNLTVDPARVQVQARRECRQKQRRTKSQMTRNRVLSQLGYQLPQFLLWGLPVRAACST